MRKFLTPQNITKLLSQTDRDNYTLTYALINNASIKDLLNLFPTLQRSNDRELFCYVLGRRYSKKAVNLLLECLTNNNLGVDCCAVIDALAKIGSPKAGETLMWRLSQTDVNEAEKQCLIVALGAVKFDKAIELVTTFLNQENEVTRGAAAWSLGALKATQALDALENTIVNETEWYPKTRILEAIDVIKDKKDTIRDGISVR